MKLYKFFSKSCIPCRTISGILKSIEIPENIELIEIDVELEENKDMVRKHRVSGVPTLSFDNGKQLVGLTNKEKILQFINGI